jgi:hypothetical protein
VAPKAALVLSGDVTANTVECVSHGFTAGDRVTCYPVLAGSLPAGLSTGVVYYVIATGLATGFATTASGAVLRPHLPWMQLMASVTDCLLGWPRDFLKCTMQAPLASNEALDLGTI